MVQATEPFVFRLGHLSYAFLFRSVIFLCRIRKSAGGSNNEPLTEHYQLSNSKLVFANGLIQRDWVRVHARSLLSREGVEGKSIGHNPDVGVVRLCHVAPLEIIF